MVKVSSEGPVRITKATIEAAWRRRAPGQRVVIRDVECRGLALVVNPTSMAWAFSYKPRGLDALTGRRFPSQSITLGSPATHSPEQARAEANSVKGRAKGGADPAGEKRAKQQQDVAKRAATVSRLADLYAADLPKRPKLRGQGLPSDDYVDDELKHLRSAVVTMKAGQKALVDLGVPELRILLSADADRPAMSRHRFGAVSRFLDWALDEGHVKLNPCAGISKAKRPKAAAARRRFLTADQVATLWKAAAGMKEAVHRDFSRFLLVVPCRRNEAATMDWAHVNLRASAWDQPDKLTKNRDPHRFHLPGLALEILRARHEAAGQPTGGWVFPAPRTKAALTTFSTINAELDELAGMTAWAWHDLRRTFATALGEAGFPEAIADAVLNHRQAATRGGVLGVYQHAERWGERKAAMEAWAGLLGAAIAGEEPSEKVTNLSQARRRRGSSGGKK